MKKSNPSPSKRSFLLFLIALVLITGLVSGQDSENSETTQLKVIQLSPDAGPADIFIDGEKVGDGLEFGGIIGQELEKSSYEIRIISENMELTRTINLEQNGPYTLVIRNRVVNPETTLLSHNTTAPSESQAKVRIAHFSPDLLDINADMQNGNSLTFQDLSYLETSEYTAISPGVYTFEVTEPRVGGATFSQEVRFRSGRTYTVFVSGVKTEGSEQGLRAIPVSGRLERQIDNGNGNGDNGDSNGDGDTDNGSIQKDFRVVCRLEEVDSES